MRARLFLGVFALALMLPAVAAKKSGKKSTRHLSRGKDFSYVLPRGYRVDKTDSKAAAAWLHAQNGSSAAMTRISTRQARKWYKGKAHNAAKKTRAIFKPEKRKGEFFSKVYKKTLPNKLKYYFFTRRARKSGTTTRKVVGFMKMGDTLYRIEGPMALKPDGLKTLYWILGTIRPVKQPKRKRAFDPGGKPAMLQEQEEKDRGVPLY